MGVLSSSSWVLVELQNSKATPADQRGSRGQPPGVRHNTAVTRSVSLPLSHGGGPLAGNFGPSSLRLSESKALSAVYAWRALTLLVASPGRLQLHYMADHIRT